eukprot:c48590_g1_i1.p1 GENE.c48590_g1_i1~~c48590_g1_i1.p1  ORF type:complete len:118 (+),score=18.03 c48590_g1_i1:1-354(+)
MGFFESLRSSAVQQNHPDGSRFFYDPVCRKPLFIAPRERSFEAWEAESIAAGLVSFRDAEMVAGNVRVDEGTGALWSVCGTYLGGNLPGKTGNQYLVHLPCISGASLAANSVSKDVV